MFSRSFITHASIAFIILVASLTSSVNTAPIAPAVVPTATATTNENLKRFGPGFAIDGLVGRVDDPLIGRDDGDVPNGAINPKIGPAFVPGGVGEGSGNDGANGAADPRFSSVPFPDGIDTPNGAINPKLTTVPVPCDFGEGSG